MKAMILAAGLGTRLRPLTGDRPKALVEVGGQTMLEIVLRRLRNFGVTEAIVNAHHHAESIAEYLESRDFGMRIEISREEELLDTGGGLKKAAWFFLEGAADEPFLLHNVDVISSIDLARLLHFHAEHGALATLAVQDRPTSRSLLFDQQGQLCGRRGRDGADELARQAASTQALGFCGIHAISARIFAVLREQGAFSIVDAYLRLAAEGEKIAAFRADGCYWRDLGRPENIAQAEHDLANGLWTLVIME